jgi:hypothetical protein
VAAKSGRLVKVAKLLEKIADVIKRTSRCHHPPAKPLDADTDPRRLMHLTGRAYDPGKSYKMVIVDTEGAAGASAHTIVPNHEKLADFAASELKDLEPDQVRQVMTPDYGEKYSEAMKEFRAQGLKINQQKHIDECKNSFFDSLNEQNLFETRAILQKRLGANESTRATA